MQVVVAGGTGFIGGSLVRALARQGARVSVITRDPGRMQRHLPVGVLALGWSDDEEVTWRRAVTDADAVVNLCGAPIAGRRWTPAVRDELRASRIGPTRRLVEAMAAAPRDRVFLSGSAVGYYGDRGDAALPESAPPSTCFLGDLCVEWEAVATEAERAGARVVLLRTGVVLGKRGGILTRLTPPFRLFMGGALGAGRQWMPWVHLDDEVGMIQWALGTPELRGPLNLVAPNPVRMREFAAALGKALHRPALA
ncbi:MAG TPA: TIGR01777 family oxidoreductase, partial [Chthonomonadales bacterium]|nr:TIGR01777 family oxidoreductase [Chthonomonadales bacterium]